LQQFVRLEPERLTCVCEEMIEGAD
jgi:hypothetical protein